MTAVAADTGAYEAHAKRDPLLLLHKGVYFLVYAGGVCYVPFLPLFLSGSGFSPAAVGGILALRPIALLLATPLFGAIADRGYRRIVLSGAIVVSTLLRGAVALTTSAPLIAALVLLGEAASAPITSVLDAAVLGILERTSSTANYGRTRMLGSVGFGVMAPFAGLLRDSVGPRAAVAAFVLITLVGGALAWWLPFERERAFLSSGGGGGGAGGRPPKPDSGGQAAAAAPALVSEPLPEAAAVLGVPDAPAAVSSASSGLGLGAFLQPSALLLLSAVAVMGVLSALIGNFHFLFLQSLGAGGGLMGWAILCNILAEAPAFMAAPLVLQVGVRGWEGRGRRGAGRGEGRPAVAACAPTVRPRPGSASPSRPSSASRSGRTPRDSSATAPSPPPRGPSRSSCSTARRSRSAGPRRRSTRTTA